MTSKDAYKNFLTSEWEYHCMEKMEGLGRDTSKRDIRSFCRSIPDRSTWDTLQVDKKSMVLDYIAGKQDEILSMCPGVKESIDHVKRAVDGRGGVSRSSQGVAVDTIRAAMWNAFYGKPGSCKP